MKITSKTIAAIILASSNSAYALSVSGTLLDWRNATYSERSNLAQVMANRLNKSGVSASTLITCINETAGDSGLDNIKISETAAACAVMMK